MKAELFTYDQTLALALVVVQYSMARDTPLLTLVFLGSGVTFRISLTFCISEGFAKQQLYTLGLSEPISHSETLHLFLSLSLSARYRLNRMENIVAIVAGYRRICLRHYFAMSNWLLGTMYMKSVALYYHTTRIDAFRPPSYLRDLLFSHGFIQSITLLSRRIGSMVTDPDTGDRAPQPLRSRSFSFSKLEPSFGSSSCAV